ncbi:polysaccharide pyruvyl transferase CsaB [Caldalkalibacillus mannanilyticus]|uniref:polysaccharide pyruvyl transferase CsaB n=1 Tax=Caldalkalibacillus mannanilyticus TaxID=1418 RepID=UPI00046A7A35|nr:polysaccharide pyruvyl transferase CsaB [Caldalkalibacillus mannanilyticus]
MSKRVLVAGYYGARNTGDEAILTGIIHSLHREGITDITVLSRTPEETREMHNVKSIYIGRKWDGISAIYKEMKKSDLFILGGGGLLQDYTRRVVPYWLSRVVVALVAGTPVMYYAQGMGPLRTSFARRLVRLVSNRVKHITLRDTPSFELLEEIGVTRPPMTITADPALAIKIESDGKMLLAKEGIQLGGKCKIAISLRPWKEDERYLPQLITALQQVKDTLDAELILIPFQYGEDEEISRQVKEQIQGENVHVIEGRYTPEQLAAMLKEMDGVIAMRLHAIILGALSCLPSFGIVYDPKVLRFMERADIDAYSWPLEQIPTHSEAFVQRMVHWTSQLESIREKMKQPVDAMKQEALKNAQIAKQLME